MYPSPGHRLTDATVRQLDDQLFTSDPFAYICLRILRLLGNEQPAFEGPTGEEFARLLGPSSAHYASCDPRTSKLQVAVDAFALRHQVAESLLRLLHVVLHHQDGHSHWVELVDTPVRTIDVISENRRVLDAQEDGGVELIRAALAPTRAVGPGGHSESLAGVARQQPDVASQEAVSSAEVDRALGVHVSWVNYAIALFLQREPDLDAAHNKFKHGMGLRPQDDVLTTFTLTPPNADGSVRLSSLTGDRAVNIFDGITTEYLSRATRKHGLEVTQLAMTPGPTLVEAAAMAHTLALLFHNAAVKHFADHNAHEGRVLPAHPGLLIDGPRPGKQRSLRPFALRFPLTTPLRDQAGPEAAMFWTNGEVNTLVFGDRMSGVVVDDATDPPQEHTDSDQ